MLKMFGNLSCNILPNDEELQARDAFWCNLFEKYSIDEGSDAELVDDDYICKEAEKIEEEDLDVSDDSMSVLNGDEDDVFDLEKIASQLKPLVEERIAAWPKKGVKLLLKTVDPSVTVEEWMQANSECTTTTTEVEKTVIDKQNKTITKSTKRTIVTKQTIQIKIAPQALDNHRHQAGKTIKSIMDASSAQKKSSQSTDKYKSNAKVLKHKKLQIPTENSIKQQSSVRLPLGKSVGTSKKIGSKLQSTPKVMPHRNVAQPTDKDERDDTVPMQELSERVLRSSGHPKVNAIHSEHVIENLVETTRQSNRKRKPEDTKQTKNERTDSITRMPSSTVTHNYAKMKQSYVRLSNVRLSANIKSSSTCDNEDEDKDVLQIDYRRLAPLLETLHPPAIGSKLFDSSIDSSSEEDDILSTAYVKLIENREIF